MGSKRGEGVSKAVDRSIGTSVHGNSPAYGFSIMITVSFGMLTSLLGTPRVVEMLLFGLAAAATVAVLEAAVTRGFRKTIDDAHEEVQMLGTALNFVSVAAGVGTALAVGELLGGVIAWPVGACLAATAYVATESSEILLAEAVQRRRDGDAPGA